jgi:hypothetical protein
MMLSMVLVLVLVLVLPPCLGSGRGPPVAGGPGARLVVARPGADTRLLCPVRGHPQPIIEWTKVGRFSTSFRPFITSDSVVNPLPKQYVV